MDLVVGLFWLWLLLIENFQSVNISETSKTKNTDTHRQRWWRTHVRQRYTPHSYMLIQTHTLLVAKYLFTHSHWQRDVNGKGQPPPGTNQSACPHALRQPSCGTDLVFVCVCVSLESPVFMTDVCVCVWMFEYSLCEQIATSVIMLIKPSQMRWSKIKGKLMLNTGWNFLFVSLSLTFQLFLVSMTQADQACRSDFWEQYWKVHEMTLIERATERERAEGWTCEVCML